MEPRKRMMGDEDMGHDRGLEYETDDEENQAQHHEDEGDLSSSSSSSSTSSSPLSSSYDHHEELGSYTTTWPRSYRLSIDMLSNVPSPGGAVGFLRGGSSLLQATSSFLRASVSSRDDFPTLGKPLITSTAAQDDDDHHHDSALPLPQPHPTSQRPSKVSFYNSELPLSPQCSTPQAIVNGLNFMCGVGLLTTPYAIKEGGWLGMLFLFGFGSISCYTGILLKKCLESSPGLHTYPDIGQAAFGLAGRLFISTILYVELYVCCVEYITLVSDSLSSMFPDAHMYFLGANLGSHQLFAVTTAMVLLPTVWLRDLSLLSYLSAVGVIASMLVVICLFWVGVVDRVGFHPDGTVLDLANLPVALGLYGFCYSGHSVFPNIYSSMNKPSNFPLVLIISFIICTILYVGVAVSGFLMFGNSVQSQFTLNMPHQYLASKVAVWTTVVNPFSKYALTMTPVALSLEELLPSAQQSRLIVVLIRTILVLSTLIVALAVPFFGFVMALLGSFFSMLVALILPCACYLSIRWKYVNFVQVVVCFSIIFVGVACACIGSYTSIKQIIDSLA